MSGLHIPNFSLPGFNVTGEIPLSVEGLGLGTIAAGQAQASDTGADADPFTFPPPVLNSDGTLLPARVNLCFIMQVIPNWQCTDFVLTAAIHYILQVDFWRQYRSKAFLGIKLIVHTAGSLHGTEPSDRQQVRDRLRDGVHLFGVHLLRGQRD